VMTFTERAAAEMRQRMESLIEHPAPAVGTFHSMALGWLRTDGGAVGVRPGFRILAGADRWILARELMWGIGDMELTGDDRPDDLVAPLLQMLDRLKQELVPLRRLQAWAASSEDHERAAFMRAAVRLFRAYEKECRARRCLDFDDLLLLAVRMLEGNPSLLSDYARRYPHVLVDEYQDLNLAQERLVELIAQGGEPFIVGDDDQSIYRFRGASRASLERFLGSFPDARTITLGRNRRSSRRIVAAASALIDRNPDRLAKQLRSDQTGPEVEVWSCPDGTAEARAIAAEAAACIERGTSPSEIAVLCRTNAIARPVASALAARGLPHVVTGGHGFHDRPEIKDLVAMLRVLRDPTDIVALARVMTRPPAGLEPGAALNKLRDRGQLSPLDAMKAWAPAAQTAAQLERFAAESHRFDVRDLFFELMETTRYLDVLNSSLAAEDASRATANVSRFAEGIAEFCELSPDHSLENYMRHLDLVLLSGEDEEPAAPEAPADAIQVMTIHQAKGLEFDVVFVPSLVEGRLPQSARSPRFELPAAVLEPLVRGREDVIAEERRLLYVAMTRARQKLYLTWGAHYEGGRRWRESRFLAEIKAAGVRTVRGVEVKGCPPAAPQELRVPHTGEVHLSYSGITAYLECPRQYWYRYEQRLPAAQSAEAVHGVIVHEALRRAGELRREGKTVSAARVKSILAEVWQQTPFPDERRAPTFKRNGAAQLEAFQKRGGFDAVPEYLEHPFNVAVDGWTLHGVIDRIDRAESGWRIVDYKSGRPVTRRKRDLQLALYALGAMSALVLDPVELEVVYLASGDSVQIDKPGSLLDEARAEGSRAAQGIREGRFDARPDRRRCRLCPYRLACSEAL
ncbi:MAG: ATP-dependent helicase, partial [Candidatus Dormibacteraceae bacterium]